MEKKFFWPMALGCALVLLICTFCFWPILGHDYALIVPGLIDLKVAWSKFGVLNPQFSPMKCLGTPLWANPISFNLSILQFFTLLTNELIGLVLFIITVTITSFWGAYRLALRAGTTQFIALYLAVGWTLQGWMFLRSTVGHVTYITVGWFPLILYLLLKQKSLMRDGLACLLAAILLSQYVFLAAPYTPFFLFMSCVCLFPLLILWKKRDMLQWKNLLLKIYFTALAAFFLLYPKVEAVRDLMSAYPRNSTLAKVGFAELLYAVLNMFSFLPHDYKTLVGWWYGNWESVQFIFPLFFISAVYFLVKNKNEKMVLRLLGSLFYLILTSFIFCSGILSDVFHELPFLNSMHVNPRWNIILSLPLFFLAASLLSEVDLIPGKWWMLLFSLAFLAPFLHLNKDNLNISYYFRAGYHEEINRLDYCYEPFLGYRLEYFPLSPESGRINFDTDSLIDPRCYLPSRECSPGSPLSKKDFSLLESYKLR